MTHTHTNNPLIRGAAALLLTLGAVTMVYPFLLMISGSFKSEVDTESFNMVPAYWFDDGYDVAGTDRVPWKPI